MLVTNSNAYDAAIIGAGLGGLVCGCYLAKAGMKVLIVEKHFKPGGYCTTFKRKDFTFDAAAHSFGGYRENGIVRKVCKDLGIDKRLNIIRFNPTDIVITPDYTISFWTDVEKTLYDFQKAFPAESNNLKSFFYFLINPDPKFFVRIRSWTFKDLLDSYFYDDKLKSILSFPLFGNGGLPPSLMSALIGAKIFIEFLLDGGYYPVGGMQELPNALAERFKELGGILQLSCQVKQIKLKDNKIAGVMLEKNEFIPSRTVISNCDARQTFFNLLGEEMVSRDFLNKLNEMIPSLSMFILYLGLDTTFTAKELPKAGVNMWHLSHYNLDHAYQAALDADMNSMIRYMVRVSPDRKSVLAFANAPSKDKDYWDSNKKKVIELFIDKLEKISISGLSDHIRLSEAATPHTLYRYTLNYKGAAYGWAITPSQLADPDMRKPSFVSGLYLTGHWTTQGTGIPGVFYAAHDTAKIIAKKIGKHDKPM